MSIDLVSRNKIVVFLCISTMLVLCLYYLTTAEPSFVMYLDRYTPLTYSSNTLTLAGKKAFLVQHKHSTAIELLKLAVSRDENNPDTWFLLGRVLFVEGRLQDSANAYRQAIHLDSQNEQAYYGLGLTNGYLKDYKSAEFDFLQYLKIIEIKKANGNYTTYPTGHWAGYNDLAWVYFLQGNFQKSEEISRSALMQYSNPWLLNMLGSSLLNQGKRTEARYYFQMAKIYLENMTAEQFGEAYSGDDKVWHAQGFLEMKKAVDDNINLTND